jgi:hypothetical protein
MIPLKFNDGQELSSFLTSHGFFAIYYCTNENGQDLDVDHYGLLKDGEAPSEECPANLIFKLSDEQAVLILEKFLKTGGIKIFPNVFTI